jgi:tRNA U54 and U55 pseudouridine synthase Pus10
MIARDAVEHSIGTSVDIFNISLDKVKSIILFEENLDSEKIYKLKISFNEEVKQDMLDISFTDIDEETRIFLNNIGGLLESTKKEKY